MPLLTTPATTPTDSPSPGARRRVAALVGGIWLISGVPIVLGLSTCPFARFLHTPCPGCGMTRAFELLLHGDVRASLAMHALAVPTLLVQLAFVVVTIVVSLRYGTPFALWKTRMGRASVYAGALVFGLVLLLWFARMAGLFNGPVPV